MKLFSCLLLTLISIEISAITPQPRFGGDSTLLKRRLYYYGGGIDEIGNMNTSTSQELIYLDIEKSFEIKSGLSAWQKVNVTGDLQPEANYLYAMAVLPRSNSIAIYGGAGSNNGQLLQNTAVLYNETTGSWQTIDDPQSNLKQVYLASFQRGKGSIGYLFGGRSYAGDVYPPFAKEMQIFDPFTYSWTTGAAVPDEYGVRFRTPSALYHNDIYYIGGMSANYTNTQITHDNTMVPMSDILIYHIDENTWEKKTATGDVPAPRIMHTVTSKPNTNSIMVFGGKYNVSTTIPMNGGDAVYVLNTGSMEWEKKNPIGVGPGPLFGHSAVFADYSSLLFIMFGVNQTGYAQSNFHVLNTETWSWSTSYLSSYSGHNEDEDADDSLLGGDDGNGKTSTGTIVGAVVGAVAGVAIVAGITFFFIRRRRNGSTLKSEDTKPNVDDTVPNATLALLHEERKEPPIYRGQIPNQLDEDHPLPPVAFKMTGPDGTEASALTTLNSRPAMKPDGE